MKHTAKPFLCLVLSALSLFAAFPATAVSLGLISDRLHSNRHRPERSPLHPNVCQKPWVPTSRLFETRIIPTKGLCIGGTQAPNLSAARAFALAASSSRFLGGALVSSERRRRVEIPAISSTAAINEASFAFDGLLKPLIFLTNCSDAARISSAVTGGSKLKRILIFLHIRYSLGSLRTLKGTPNKKH